MDVIDSIRRTAMENPDRTAFRSGTQEMSYGELWDRSGRLADWICRGNRQKEDAFYPVAVYGHKSPWMLVCFLGLVRSGRAYCPIDISVPEKRVESILTALPSDIVLTCELPPADLLETEGKEFILPDRLEEICTSPDYGAPAPETAVKGEDLFYLIFTSGSTGIPKGVQITADCLNHYLDWSTGFVKEKGLVFLNQAPFSFDLSVMDLYTCLAAGGTEVCLPKTVQSNYAALLDALKNSGAQVWVSTPSFADVCLADPAFCEALLPELRVFLFCGETLLNRTARKLIKLFPKAKVYNTYGPTESTVAVTGIEVTKELAECSEPLPVGYAKPGTRIEIHSPEGRSLAQGLKGEIVIIGNTVSPGYYRQPELSRNVFFVPGEKVKGWRGYRTGDEGYLKEGCLYYCGRIDLQVKLHGYRIELGDIENNLCRLSAVKNAVVLPNERGGKISSLTAYIVLEPAFGDPEEPDPAGKIRKALSGFLPDYMIPKKIIFVDEIPMTPNGKADRKKLADGKNKAAGRQVSNEGSQS